MSTIVTELGGLYPMRVVSRLTGLTADTIRVWERRYQAVKPERTRGNKRRYTGSQVRRLVLLRRATELGHSIGQVAPLPDEDLHRIIGETTPDPDSDIVGGEDGWNTGWQKIVGPGLDVEKIEVAAMALGVAAAALDDAWEYAQERKQFGKPVSAFQSIRHMLADCKTKLQACRLMTYHAAWLLDQKQPASVETSMAKLFVCDTGKEIVLTCQQVMGAYGYIKDFDMERYVRESLVMPIFGGSSAIQKNNIANRLRLASK